MIKVDDVAVPFEQVLRDPKLNILLSNEGVMSVFRYPSEAASTSPPHL
jgi:hypothetical protein